jgi:hypothetical protein
MYLKTTTNKQTGRKYLSCVYGYRDASGRSHTRIYQSYGYLDDLAKTYDDPIAHFKQVIAELNANRLAMQRVHSEIQDIQKPGSTPQVAMRNLGYIVPMAFYYKLGIDTFWRRIQSKHSLMFDLNAVFRMFVMLRVLEPAADSDRFYDFKLFFERHDFSDHDVFQALELFSHYHKSFLRHLRRSVAKLRTPGRAKDLPLASEVEEVFCDLFDLQLNTNQSTKQSAVHQTKQDGCRQLVHCGFIGDQSGIPLGYGYVIDDGLFSLDYQRLLKDSEPTRRKDPDPAPGFPHKVTVVADMQLGSPSQLELKSSSLGSASGASRNPALASPVHYLTSLDIHQLGPEEKAWAASNHWDTDLGDTKVKSQVFTYPLMVEDASGHRDERQVPCKLICYWNRQNCERKRRAGQTLTPAAFRGSTNRAAGAATSAGALGAQGVPQSAPADTPFAHSLHYDVNGELCEGLRILVCTDTSISAVAATMAYSRLLNTAKMFGHVKPLLYDMPSRFKRSDFIEAHFAICYTAALLLAMIGAATDYRYGQEQISEELSHLFCLNTDANQWQITYWSPILDDLCKAGGIHFNANRMTLTQIKHKIAAVRRG